jgi:hypothetical protein
LPSPAGVPESRPLHPSQRAASTLRAYAATAEESNGLSHDMLSAAADAPRSMAGMCSGLVVRVMADIARGRAADLLAATGNLLQRLSDAVSRQPVIRDVADLQEKNQYAVVAEIPDRLRHAGSTCIRCGAALVDDLRQQFGNAYYRDLAVRGYRNDFVEIGLIFKRTDAEAAGTDASDSDSDDAEGHSIVVQRLRPSADYEHDEYEIYDPNFGAFRYAGFAQMACALKTVFEKGYPECGGIDHADTTYFADTRREQQVVPALSAPSTARGSAAADLPLGDVERMLGVGGSPALTPPHAALPPPPDAGGPRLPFHPDHDEFKRSLDPPTDRKPYELFRPSTVSPDALKARGGFDCEHTKLRDIDLNLHDADLASRPYTIDSAGYLATFRSAQVALERLPPHAQGFIYSVAPAPHMIDASASLGSSAREPRSGEVPAMGRIDCEQIRGWREVKDGVPGTFVANPTYRWDVYDQTRIAGAQPQLARFPVTSDAWRDGSHRAFVSAASSKRAPAFDRDPNLVHAEFYDSAWQKVRDLQMRQAMGVDYRGPLTIQAYGGDASKTHLFVDGAGQIAADTAYSPYARRSGNRRKFTMGDDGRFHLADDYRSVLRVGHNGYVYLGPIPRDPDSWNGVFAYDGKHLVHREDDKFLTIGRTVYTPFVTTADYGWRSDWRLERSGPPGGRRAVPPSMNLHTFRGCAAGSARQLFQFEQDPASALPESATHFVTHVPDNALAGDFGDCAKRITTREARDAARRLASQNAAWLFRDGYYAVPDGNGGLEVRTLGGAIVWRSADAADAGDVAAGAGGAPRGLPERAGAAYRISDDTWHKVQQGEARREQLDNMLTHVYFMR